MPLGEPHIHMQHGHAQANSQVQKPRVDRISPGLIAGLMKYQYNSADYERNNKSGLLRWVFSSAAARRQFATSA